ncbi:MAG: glycosyltransferase family 9 protein [Desulfuromonadaceae bacterium]|nr:glycosyltransferase family 9 protein [Desulfuromonadaceae bacterium]MDD2848190.1 glycosyltransferase family 9 protein [Desulfuromonadaceae bacterium]MDD4130643.1 glycosyltransferase family 9 protein [Desulfuromonadaceae bacterium]
MNQKPQNILIIKPGAMGDLLQLTPTIRALRNSLPHARIDIMVGNSASIDLFRHHPDIADVLVYDRRGEHRSFSALLSLWKQIRSRSYDLVINFQRSNLKTWFLTSAALPCRILTYHKTRKRVLHAVLDHLKTVKPLGVYPDGEELDLYLSPDDRQYATELFESHAMDNRPVVAINPGASHPVNRWSTAQFAALADRISNELNAAVIIVGGGGDTPLAHDIDRLSSSHPLLLTGTTTLLQLGAVLEKSALLVSGDTGPMHMATAVRTPVIALFGAADPERTGPTGSGNRILQAADLDCVPCRSRKCSNSHHMECMERITVDDVFEAVKEMLNMRNPCVS